MEMTRQERLARCFLHQETDRPAVVVRWWTNRDDPSYADLRRLAWARADWIEPWDTSGLILGPVPQETTETRDGRSRKVHTLSTPLGNLRWSEPPEHWPLKDADDAEKYLSLPLPRITGGCEGYIEKVREVGDRGIVLASLPENPAGIVNRLFGPAGFALMSVYHRELLHRLMEREYEIQVRLLKHLFAAGVGPFFYHCGQEYLVPPMHGRDDFLDFNLRYDRPLAALIHDAGGRLGVHCHGRLHDVLDAFVTMGADVLHPIEPPPLGDVTAREAKDALRGKVTIEGNIQIVDFYERGPDSIRQQVKDLIRDAFDDGRGLIVSPSASPYMVGRGAACLPQYHVMIDAVMEES